MVLSISAFAHTTAVNSFNKFNHSIQNSEMNLASGLVIKSAKDNAAGLSIMQNLNSKIKGIGAATRNSQDAVSMLNTADSGLGAINKSLQRVRELTVQASNGTLGDSERAAIQAEIDSEMSKITDTAKFNDKTLLDGSAGTVSFQTGSEDINTTTVNLSGDFSTDAAAAAGNINAGNTGAGNGTALSDIDVQANTSAADFEDALKGIDNAIANVSAMETELGAKTSSLESNIDALNVTSQSYQEAKSVIADTDFASEASILIQSKIMQSGSAAMIGQSNLNSGLVLSLLP